MSDASPHLRRIVEIFRNSGISNEVRIAEHVAFLLLIRPHWEELRELHPRTQTYDRLAQLYEPYASEFDNLEVPAPPTVNFDVLFDVLNTLEAAVRDSPYSDDLGAFFQREIRFELLKATSGSQYPTPHHVAAFMTQLAVTGSTEKVLDPTAGTGGLLVAAHAVNENAQLFGIDFDSQWVGLASANLILNGATSATMYVEQVLNRERSRDFANYFDSVVMNPPFGGTRSPHEVGDTLGNDHKFGRTSSTVLAALALNMLMPGGITAFLQPSGTLFGGGGEAHLRRVLMQKFALDAVITLPPDAMQPYSQVATHLFVAHNASPSSAVWFMTLTSDGYPAGTARDLTTEPKPEQNDLPRARDLVLANRENRWQTRLKLDGIGDVQTVRLGAELPGLGIRLSDPTSGIRWDVSHLADGALVRLWDASGSFIGWLYESYRGDEAWGFAANQSRLLSWKNRLPRATWADGISSAWQAGSENVTVEVDQQKQQIKIQRDNTRFVFSQTDDTPVSACLLDTNGQQMTPWLGVADENRQSVIQSSDFGESLGASSIRDASGKSIGWLLDLTSTEGDQEQQSTLLIVIATECHVFSEGNSTDYALIENGWLNIGADGVLNTRSGSSVRLRDEVTQGFAIGPAAVSGETGHSLFGILGPSSAFIDGDQAGDMRPSRFLPDLEAATPLGHPLDVLASIRRSQTQLSGKVDSLLAILGQSGRYDESAEKLANIPDWMGGMLSNQQRQLLNLLRSKLAGEKPRHFNDLDVAEWCKSDGITYSVDDIQQQLRLLIRLGVIKAVHTNGHNLYRMITVADVQQVTDKTQNEVN